MTLFPYLWTVWGEPYAPLLTFPRKELNLLLWLSMWGGGYETSGSTAFRYGHQPYTSKRLEEIESADILISIPCYNNEMTIEHVIQMATHGLAEKYKDRHSVILLADGGSTDDSRDLAKEFQIKPWQERSFPSTGDRQEKAQPSVPSSNRRCGSRSRHAPWWIQT
jgi:hypothetical protein